MTAPQDDDRAEAPHANACNEPVVPLPVVLALGVLDIKPTDAEAQQAKPSCLDGVELRLTRLPLLDLNAKTLADRQRPRSVYPLVWWGQRAGRTRQSSGDGHHGDYATHDCSHPGSVLISFSRTRSLLER